MTAGGYALLAAFLALVSAVSAWRCRVMIRLRDEVLSDGTPPETVHLIANRPRDLAGAAVVTMVGATVLGVIALAKALF